MTKVTVIKFTEGRDKLMSGEKHQTIRTGGRKWGDRIDATPAVSIRWVTPGEPDTELMRGYATYEYLYGYQFDAKTVMFDGYNTHEELYAALMRIYDMTHREVMFHLWVAISWKRDETFIYSGNKD